VRVDLCSVHWNISTVRFRRSRLSAPIPKAASRAAAWVSIKAERWRSLPSLAGSTAFALVSTSQDEVIRLFFSQGNNNCASDNATWDGLAQLLGGGYAGAQYTQGLNDLLSTFQCTGRFAGYLIGGQNVNYLNPTYHQHIFRDEFYKALTNDGGITMAQWTSDFVAGKPTIVGP